MKNLLEETIDINSKLADAIKEKAFEVYKNRYNKTKTSNKDITKPIEILLFNKYKLDKIFKSHTYHTTFHGKEKNIKQNSDAFILFVVFCHYISTKENYTIIENSDQFEKNETIFSIDDLYHPLYDINSKSINTIALKAVNGVLNFFEDKGNSIEPDEVLSTIIRNQITEWETKGVKHFACYYSNGNDLPGAWLITVRKNWEEVELTEYIPSERTLTGSMLKPQNGKNVFLSFFDEKKQLHKLFSLKGKQDVLSEITVLKGHFSTGLDSDENDPIAGKVILEKIVDPENFDKIKKNDIPPNLTQELLNEYLKIKNSSGNVDSEVLSNIKGVYRAYWFLSNGDDVVVREMAVQILENGIINIRDYRAETLPGYINLLDSKTKTLRCAFEPAEDGYNFRMQMVLDVSHTKASVYDGVFSGQTLGWREIIAGKIRLYRSSRAFLEINPKAVVFADIIKEFKIRGPELVDFFWGKSKLRDTFSNNYILPNYGIFSQEFDERKEQIIPITKGDSRVIGNYIMYRLDSSRRYIYRYKLTINLNGTVEYSLEINSHIHTYNGIIRIQNYCLTIHTTQKDGEPYEALYIFYFAGKSKSQYNVLSGVYASIATVGGAALAGRAMLESVNDFPEKLTQIEVFSEEYYALQKLKAKNMITLLTGFGDNSIKSSRDTDSFFWKVHYDQAFFNHACYHKALEPNQKRDYLIFAFEHGYADIKKLKEELENEQTLKSIDKLVKIEISDKSDRFSVIIDLEKGNRGFEGLIMNK